MQHHWMGTGTQNISQHSDIKCPPQGAQVHNRDSFNQQLHQSAHTAEFKCNFSSFPWYAELFPHTNAVNLQKEAFWKRQLSLLQALLPYLLHRPWQSFFGKPGLWLPFNGESFPNPLFSINLIKGFLSLSQTADFCTKYRTLQLRKWMFRKSGVCKNRMAINYGSEGAHTWIHSSVKWRQGLKGIIQNTGTTLYRVGMMTTALLPLYPKFRLIEHFPTYHSVIQDTQPAGWPLEGSLWGGSVKQPYWKRRRWGEKVLKRKIQHKQVPLDKIPTTVLGNKTK